LQGFSGEGEAFCRRPSADSRQHVDHFIGFGCGHGVTPLAATIITSQLLDVRMSCGM
jgi:hypothetical protein